ncbi:hypothetical protein WG66_008618 [Moniliophthora roreri]|nr:hypothetical protein WG66_008618 [Moniliophthora roreri]
MTGSGLVNMLNALNLKANTAHGSQATMAEYVILDFRKKTCPRSAPKMAPDPSISSSRMTTGAFRFLTTWEDRMDLLFH